MLLAKSELAVCSWEAGLGKSVPTQLAGPSLRRLGRRRSAAADFANRVRPFDETKQDPARRPAGLARCPLKQALTARLRG